MSGESSIFRNTYQTSFHGLDTVFKPDTTQEVNLLYCMAPLLRNIPQTFLSFPAMVRHAKQSPRFPAYRTPRKEKDTKALNNQAKGTRKYHDEYPRGRSTRREKLVRLDRV
ncbi:Uncharacterized protein HZ326_25947 [Fusarium oxysporum f. sp. albedinis]|nr:Uncharacterized protein HZ326_25947 [Fusarium oxysporum f. sp. albedinis]